MAATTALLSGMRVLDMSIWRPGPYATSLLVALGADVLKVEPPGGDPMRSYAGLFAEINAGKRSIELDLKDATGRSRAMTLAEEADVLVEGFRPGVMARLGMDDAAVRAVNPGIVYCSISGYGQQDDRAALPGHDVNYQAWAGALTPEGGTASISPLPIADLAAGMTAAFGICAGLLGRTASGEGTYLDVSMTDVLSTWTGRVGAGAPAGQAKAGPTPGYGIFVTADGGQVALGVVNEQHFWTALCTELGLPDEARLSPRSGARRGGELQDVIGASIASRARDPLVASLVAAGVPVAPVLDRRSHAGRRPVPRLPNPAASARRPGRSPRSTSTGERASATAVSGGTLRPACYVAIGPLMPMTQISDLLTANRGYAAARANVADPRPGRHLAVVTCMDARIDVFAVLGLHLGEAHVIRNAGGRVTTDVLRSLALSSGVLGVDTAVVMQHTKCGLAGVTDAELRELTGADLGFFPIDDHAAALREDVDMLARTPYLTRLRMIAGLVYDVESGELDDVVRWERPG